MPKTKVTVLQGGEIAEKKAKKPDTHTNADFKFRIDATLKHQFLERAKRLGLTQQAAAVSAFVEWVGRGRIESD
jgi:hypothetical protein